MNQQRPRLVFGGVGERDKRGVHVHSWDELRNKKSDGGVWFSCLGIGILTRACCTRMEIIDRKTSLVQCVLKAKYYSSSSLMFFLFIVYDSFLGVQMDLNQSWTCHIILEGRKVLLVRMRWRISNARSVKVVLDSWLAKDFGFPPMVVSKKA